MNSDRNDRHGHDDAIQADRPPSAAGIQADKPVLPWGQPGGFRLDCEPHRGVFLICAAWAQLVLAGLLCLLVTPLFGLIVSLVPVQVALIVSLVPVLVTLLLNVLTGASARRDLALMQKGLMDPGGQSLTQSAFALCCLAAVPLALLLQCMLAAAFKEAGL